MKKSIGILGGMGPLATADLFTKIVTMTKSRCDNGHIRVYIDNNSAIPDRTAAILSGGVSPVKEMTSALRNLEACGADCIIMPCNTAHYFLPELQKLTNIPFISILDATSAACNERFHNKTAGILATKGTLASKLYDNALQRKGISFITPSEDEKDMLMRVIYDGVKADAPCDAYKTDMVTVMQSMSSRGADYFILGCTELPVAFSALGLEYDAIDPTLELAKAAIRFCGYEINE